MGVSRRLFLAALMLCAAASHVRADGAAPGAGPPSLENTLTSISEEIVEAIRSGNRALLDRHLAGDAILVDRDGREYARQALLDQVVPMPEGYDARFEIREPRVIDHGDTALLTFLLDEHLTIFGHDVSTVYRNHLLFHRREGRWLVLLYTYWEKPSTPPVIRPDPASLDAATGTYELAPGRRVMRVIRDGDGLRLQRDGGQPRELLPMAGDRFYLAGVEGEYFFEKDASGKATALVFRRNWIDLRHGRVP